MENSTVRGLGFTEKSISNMVTEAVTLLSEYEAGGGVPIWFLKDIPPGRDMFILVSFFDLICYFMFTIFLS